MSYKIAICDDNYADVQYISTLVSSWINSAKLAAQIHTFSSAEEFLFNYEDEKDYDILLLDIEMKEIDGVTLAKNIRKENDTIQIVFITGYSDYISEGYDVSALHYLMKPINHSKLFEVLDRAVDKLRKNERLLTLELPNEILRIPFHEIRYLEVYKNYVTIHGKQDYTLKRTLSEFEKELDDRFFRVSRSYIINLLYIEKVTRNHVYLSDNSVIPLSRGMYEPLNRAIISKI